MKLTQVIQMHKNVFAMKLVLIFLTCIGSHKRLCIQCALCLEMTRRKFLLELCRVFFKHYLYFPSKLKNE